MNHKLTLTLAFLGLTALFSCQKPEPEVEALIDVTPAQVTANAEGMTSQLYVTSNTKWSASCEADWVTLDSTEGEGDGFLGVTVAANTAPEGKAAASRNTSIVLTAGSKSVTVPVNQKAEDVVFAVDGKAEVPAEGGDVKVKVEANCSYSVAISETWVTQVQTKAIKTDNLTFSVEANMTASSRTAKITLTPDSGQAQEINVIQASGETTLTFACNAGLPSAGVDIVVISDSPKIVTVEAAKGAKSFQATLPMANQYAVICPSGITSLENNAALRVRIPSEQDGTMGPISAALATRTSTSLSFMGLSGCVTLNADANGLSRLELAAQMREHLAADFLVTLDGTTPKVEAIDSTYRNVIKVSKASGDISIAVMPVAMTKGMLVMPYKAVGVETGAFVDEPVGINQGQTYAFGKLSAKTTKTYSVSDFATLNSLIAQPLRESENVQTDTLAFNKAWRLAGTVINLSGTIEATAQIKVECTGFPYPYPFTVNGPATIDGNNATSLFILGNNADITFNNVTFQNAFCGTHDGAALQIAAGKSANSAACFNKCSFSGNRVTDGNEGTQGKSGGAICVAKGTAKLKECVFSGNYGRNGASIYTNSASSVVEATDCKFNGETTYNTGGAANNSGGKQEYVNCTFTGCKTQIGTGGAIHVNASTAEVKLKACTFAECEANTNNSYTKVDNKAAGGAISLQEGYLDIDDCLFDGNMASAASCLLLQSGSGLARINNCIFKNHKGASRGLIQTNGKAAVFMNNCKIFDNNMRTNQWGRVVHGLNPSVVCMNNCTIYNNTSAQAGGNSVCLNNDGYVILANSTLVDSNALTSIRNTQKDLTDAHCVVTNSAVWNTDANGYVFKALTTVNTSYVYNSYLSKQIEEGAEKVIQENCMISADGLPSGAWNETTATYSWAAPAGYKTATSEEVKTQMKMLTTDNGNTRVNGAIGEKFVEWLDSLK